MIGSYGIRAIYSGQFASWNITYLGAESTEITLTVLSDVTPKTWTVDDDGPADFRTIQEAINAAEEGDTILVMSGFYREAVVVNKTLSLQGTNKRDTIIDGNNSWTVVTVWANSSSISGFTIQNSGDYPEGLIIEYSSGNSIHGNTIKNSGNRGIEINQINNEVTDNEVLNAYYGILLMSSSNNSVANNKVVNSVYGIMLYEGCQNNTVHANNISLCRNAGIVVGPVPAGGSYAKSYGNLISENTLLGNGDGICLGGASYGNTVVGNIIRENAQGFYLQGTVDNK
jgi:parallel beta-helix repeat protein